MNHDENKRSGADPSDEFWGSTPDWTDSVRRPRRKRSEGRADVTGAIKGLWNAALTSGVEGTREHRVLDADAPRPDLTPGPDPTMFDDLDTEVPLSPSGRVHITPVSDDVRSGFDFLSGFDDESPRPTTETPEVPESGAYSHALVDDDDERFSAMTPVPLVERNDKRRGAGGHIDPLLARLGAVVVVTTLLVPIGIAMASDDGDDTVASAADDDQASDGTDRGNGSIATVATDPTPESTAATGTADASGSTGSTDSDAAKGSTATTEALDPATLPPAKVVNPTSSEGSSESSTTAAADDASDGSSSASTAGADECAIDYDVQFGDFWLRLADSADVSLSDLLAVNGATIESPLYPDSTICLPAGASTPAPPAPPATAASTTAAPTTAAPTTAAPTTAAPTTAAPTTAAPTTAAPTTEAPTTTAPAPPPSPAGPEDIKQIIRDVWPDHLEDRALEIAYRESRYVPTAKNYCCYGLFQIYWSVHQGWLGDLGITDDQQLYDPATNARAAYALYQRSGGWGPWSL